MADVQRTFTHLARIVPRNGWVVLNGDDSNLRALGPMAWTRVVRVGQHEGCDTRIADFTESAAGATFTLLWRGQPWARTPVWGLGFLVILALYVLAIMGG